MFLKDIIHTKKHEIQEKKQKIDVDRLIREAKNTKINKKIFSQSIKRSAHEKIKFIGEIKKASPSKGIIRDPFDPLEISSAYDQCGVNAISVLTDEKYFQGSLNYLQQVSHSTELPVLRKDFIIDPYQIYEAKVAHASAVLLIVAVLDEAVLRDFILLADAIDLEALVEVHSADELKIAISANARIIGINNRDLETFKVDLKVSDSILEHVPNNAVLVVESGIHTREDVLHFEKTSADALLIGEAFMKEKNIKKQINALMGRNS